MADLLVVEDDAELSSLFELVLLDRGHAVRVAPNGEEGLRRLSQKRPDLVLMDVEMPVLTGPQMVERMFVENLGRENIPVLIVSGVERLASVAARVGTPYFLAKPFSVEALLDQVDRALDERTPPRPAP